MPAEWQLRAYRVDLAKLTAVVGSGDKPLRRAVLAAAKAAKLDADERIEDDKTFAEVVDEILAGTLDRDHACGYRIAMEAFAEVTSTRLRFDVNALSKNYDALTTYADRSDLGTILTKLGVRALGRNWDGNVKWPWSRGEVAADWPAAMYWTAAELATAATQLEAANKRGPLDERVRGLTDDAFFADDNADVVTVIAQVVAKARVKPPSKRPRCVSANGNGLLVLCDGEFG